MYKDLKEYYWWQKMKRDIAEYIAKCGIYQQVKVEHQKPTGPLQPFLIPEWKWDNITMNFMTGLPKRTKGNNVIWVIIDRLTKFALFLPMKMTNSMDRLAQLYVREVIRLYGILVSIISYRDSRFTSWLWSSIQHVLGTQLDLSTTFYLQVDGQYMREPLRFWRIY